MHDNIDLIDLLVVTFIVFAIFPISVAVFILLAHIVTVSAIGWFVKREGQGA